MEFLGSVGRGKDPILKFWKDTKKNRPNPGVEATRFGRCVVEAAGGEWCL